jgi:hypothetical protein
MSLPAAVVKEDNSLHTVTEEARKIANAAESACMDARLVMKQRHARAKDAGARRIKVCFTSVTILIFLNCHV